MQSTRSAPWAGLGGTHGPFGGSRADTYVHMGAESRGSPPKTGTAAREIQLSPLQFNSIEISITHFNHMQSTRSAPWAGLGGTHGPFGGSRADTYVHMGAESRGSPPKSGTAARERTASTTLLHLTRSSSRRGRSQSTRGLCWACAGLALGLRWACACAGLPLGLCCLRHTPNQSSRLTASS